MNGLPDIAQHLAAQGRNGDTMLMHVTPGEVRGLQALAQQHGTSLTINPDTGLPEAFSLRSLLPMIAGIALTPVLGPMGAALAVGGGTTVATGDIKQGLMAGLGAYGGASLGAGLGAAGAANAPVFTGPMVPDPTVAASSLTPATAIPSAVPGAASAVTPGAATPFTFDYVSGAPLASQAAPIVTPPAAPPLTLDQLAAKPGAFTSGASAGLTAQSTPYLDTSNLMAGEVSGMGRELIPRSVNPSYADMLRGTRDVFSSGPTGDAARSTFMSNIGGYGGLARSAGMAGAPVFADAMRPKPFKPIAEEEDEYEGPYEPTPRQVRYPTEEERRRRGTGEFSYFSPSNPVPFQEGGDVGPTISPAEAQLYQNIANAQMLAGLPAIDVSRFAVRPPLDRASLVYNPIVPGTGPVGGMEGERNYGFEPLMSKKEAEKKVKAEMARDEASFLGPASTESLFAKGGVPMLEDGGFVLTKKAVDGLGKGDNKKGQKVASAGLGAIPIKGPGHGTSDSIRTSIEGKQPALVSNGEAYVPRRSVQKNGGAKKFYALMKAAERRA